MEGRRSVSSNSILKKTCHTCFKAKIRCDRKQDTGACDRCSRLSKTCVFLPTKKASRRTTPSSHSRRMEQLETRGNVLTRPESSTPQSEEATPLSGVVVRAEEISQRNYHLDCSTLLQNIGTGAIAKGLVSAEDADVLLDVYTTQMAVMFPFAIIPKDTKATQLWDSRPHFCSAILAVASFKYPSRQLMLGQMFNEGVSAALSAAGTFATIDLLQGLLVYLAWAHYQPRPRRYSQHLHLAVSIVADLRLDRPRSSMVWSVELPKTAGPDWGPEELRALIGAYYLASSSSVVIMKLRCFSYTSFVLEAAESLAEWRASPTDECLPYVVRIQRLGERASDIANLEYSRGEPITAVEDLRAELYNLKSAVTFPFSEHPILLLQINTLELQISQLGLPDFPFATARLPAPGTQLLHWLSESVSAVKAVLDGFVTMPPRGELTMVNLGFIVCGFALSLGVKLDILAADPRISAVTNHVRRSLDTENYMRQVSFKLESAAATYKESQVSLDAMSRLLKRVKAIEAWYHRQTRTTPDASSPAKVSQADSSGTSEGLLVRTTDSPENQTPGLAFVDTGSLVEHPGMNFSVTDIWDDLESQGITFGPSMFSEDYQPFI